MNIAHVTYCENVALVTLRNVPSEGTLIADIFTAISEEDGLTDLKRSIEVCGSSDAFAYPFGDYNESSRSMVEKAGFLCAVTTEYGKAEPGDDPMLLPRVRMSMGQSLAGFQDRVSP